jgi:hypothetical protein
MSQSRRYFELLITLVTLLLPGRIFAVSCTTQSQMSESERAALVQSSRTIASAVQSGNASAVQALTIPKVKAQFDPIASMIEQAAPLMAGATVTIDALYGLDASDLKSAVEDTVFFCGVAGSPVHVDLTIPQLPQGKYALALVHATGVRQPQQMAFLLQNNGEWQLAGLFVKPLLLAGHDSVWYWTKARAFNQKGQKWNAYFYYTTAAYLATPADFLNSANLDKLNQETAASKPDGLPGAQPMVVNAGGQTYSVNELHTDGSLGGLDLVLRYSTTDAADPVATRQRPYGNELAISEIH